MPGDTGGCDRDVDGPLSGVLLDLLWEIAAAGVKMRVEDNALRYSAPPGVSMAPWLHVLREHRKGLIEHFKWARGPKRSAGPLRRMPPRDAHPVSARQNHYWASGDMTAHATASHAYDIHGRLNLVAFERSVFRLVRRHAILRSTFNATDGVLVQSATATDAVHVSQIKAGLMALDQRARFIRLQQQAIWEKAVLLRQGTLFGVATIAFSQSDHAVLIHAHPLVLDEDGIRDAFKELMRIYSDISKETDRLAPSPIAYHDFAQWEAEWLTPSVKQRCMDFWGYQAAGGRPVSLLADLAASDASASLPFRIPRVVYEDAQRLTEQSGVPLRVVFAAAYVRAVGAWAHESDLVLDYLTQYKPAPELTGALGNFASNLLIRCDLDCAPTLIQTARRLYSMLLIASRYGGLGAELANPPSANPRIVFAFNPFTRSSGAKSGRSPMDSASSIFSPSHIRHHGGCGTALKLHLFELDGEIDAVLAVGGAALGQDDLDHLKSLFLNEIGAARTDTTRIARIYNAEAT